MRGIHCGVISVSVINHVFNFKPGGSLEPWLDSRQRTLEFQVPVVSSAGMMCRRRVDSITRSSHWNRRRGSCVAPPGEFQR